MTENHSDKRSKHIKSNCDYCSTYGLSLQTLIDIAIYTAQKINNYPKSFGITVENYFHLLFPDEIKSHLMRQSINGETPCNADSVEIETYE